MKKKIVIGVIIAVLIAGFVSLFPHKVKYQERVTVCTQEGETTIAEFDVELWKYWYMQDVMKGSVTLDGVVYEHLEYKHQGSEIRSFMFAVPVGEGWDHALNVSLYGEDFEAFVLVPIQDGESKMYIGPAANVEEMKEVEDIIK